MATKLAGKDTLKSIGEGEFGIAKRSYGFNRTMAHLLETSFCVSGISLLCINLEKSLRKRYLALAEMWIVWCNWNRVKNF